MVCFKCTGAHSCRRGEYGSLDNHHFLENSARASLRPDHGEHHFEACSRLHRELIETIYTSVIQFRKTTSLADDLTLVLLKKV